jgi:copper chaperone NosL
MKKYSKIFHLAAVVLLIGLYFFPLWQIRLEAAQYPEGIAMYIWLNKITGSDPNTLNSINILNHYIGMQPITPESIPELTYFPFVNLFLIVSGIAAFIWGERKLRLGWGITLLALGVLAMYDFYLWEYDYGHNLDPQAAIKIPGMSYQPPLLGSQWLLNFKAHSYPHIGGILLAVSSLLVILVSFLDFGLFRKAGKQAVKFALLAGLLVSQSCSSGPEPINYGSDNCALCSMTIMDRRYGTEAVTAKGRILKFDSIECLVRHINEPDEEGKDFKYLLVTDYIAPETLVGARESVYLISNNLPSPMGAYLTGFSTMDDAARHQKEHEGQLFSWEELLDHFAKPE